jgi:hypothetical protein
MPIFSSSEIYLKQILAVLEKALEFEEKSLHVQVLNTRIIEESLCIQKKILDILEPALTQSIRIKFTGDASSMANALVFNVGQTSQASIQPLLADNVTPSGGTVSAVTFTFSDPSATVVLNADGLTATCTGVAASTGPVSGSAACTVTDTDGVVSTWNQAFTIQTNAVVPPQQLTQSVQVNFSTPTP